MISTVFGLIIPTEETSFFFILLTIKYNPIWNKIEIIEKNPWHNGTVYQLDIPCEDNKNQICKKKFKTQPFFYEVLNNFEKSAYWETYKQALTIWRDYPIFGIGIKNYTNACKLEKYKENLKYFFCTTHPHNFYIQWLLETGILGLFGFIILLFIWSKHFINIIEKNTSPLIYSPILSLIVLFWPIMSTGSFFSNRNATMNWFIIALCLAITNMKKNISVDMSCSIIHNGHIRLLKRASKFGRVFVALTSDEDIKKHKNLFLRRLYCYFDHLNINLNFKNNLFF